MTWLNSSAVRERYRGAHNQPISLRTLHHWVTRGRIPRPVKIGPRNYWASEQLDAHDQARTAVSQPSARQMLDRVA
jgi:predicted DNA-binding transcriptional regulator AlpA